MTAIFSDEIIQDIDTCLKELAVTTAFLSMDRYMQHGDTTCLWHSIAVAYYSLLLVRMLRITCDRDSLLTGALFHDYFLYDWHAKDRSHRFHGFRHPKTALKNAMGIKNLNPIERDIICRHMFPLTPIPPVFKESIIVCLVDKFCSFYETICRNTYKTIKGRGVIITEN